MEEESAAKELLGWLLAFIVVLVVGMVVHFFVLEPFIVDGPSMEPSFVSGDRILLSKISYLLGKPERGEIVVFRYQADPSRDFVKRIIGLPGDMVQVRSGYVFVNGKELTETYISTYPLEDFPATRVPQGCYFVLGDNRRDSLDSRDANVGFVSSDAIIGKAALVIWPLADVHFIRTPEYKNSPKSPHI